MPKIVILGLIYSVFHIFFLYMFPKVNLDFRTNLFNLSLLFWISFCIITIEFLGISRESISRLRGSGTGRDLFMKWRSRVVLAPCSLAVKLYVRQDEEALVMSVLKARGQVRERKGRSFLRRPACH